MNPSVRTNCKSNTDFMPPKVTASLRDLQGLAWDNARQTEAHLLDYDQDDMAKIRGLLCKLKNLADGVFPDDDEFWRLFNVLVKRCCVDVFE